MQRVDVTCFMSFHQSLRTEWATHPVVTAESSMTMSIEAIYAYSRELMKEDSHPIQASLSFVPYNCSQRQCSLCAMHLWHMDQDLIIQILRQLESSATFRSFSCETRPNELLDGNTHWADSELLFVL